MIRIAAPDAVMIASSAFTSRKPLPGHQQRNDTVLSPGEDITEEPEYIPGRFVVNRIIRPRRACTCCEAIVQASLPSRPIDKGHPGPGLLAHLRPRSGTGLPSRKGEHPVERAMKPVALGRKSHGHRLYPDRNGLIKAARGRGRV